MHRVLEINEILVLILQLIPHESKHPTAAAVASTCRAFYEPAYDALWEELPAMRPLFNLLPRDLLARAGFRHDVARELGAQEWARFLNRCARVKTLTLKERDGGDDLEDRIRTIVLMRRGSTGPILPKAHTLLVDGDFFAAGRGHVGHLPLFVGPEIREVRFTAGTSRQHREIVEQLMLSCPRIQSIGLLECRGKEARLLPSFAGLETVVCSGNVDLPILARVRSLRHLSVPLASEPVGLTGTEDAASAIVRFPVLETLKLRGIRHSRHVIPLLESIHSPRLHKIHLETSNQRHPDAPRSCGAALTALASHFPRLRSLTLDGWWPLATFPHKAITELHHLEELCLTSGKFTLADQCIVDLGGACPALRHLEVYSAQRQDERLSSWTLHALELAVTHLPRLEHLATNFDTLHVDTLAAPRATSRAPMTLAVTKSPLYAEHIRPAAAYISSVYPNARFGLPENYVVKEGDEDHRRWGQVAQAVLLHKDVV
ncbi:hypothetical protein PsYK624_052610 [Phanerochaete sordida]|uniref:F-box domain-containing protein n=1 Tax=Phanerochaete sordida TaxID=48140 RepID=A0A9P3G6H8_9APHY|nr:hypothetical protein PsYK624_052610 [Phanerochaete sordida]